MNVRDFEQQILINYVHFNILLI